MMTFIEINWMTLASVLIGLFVTYFFYRLQKIDLLSAREKRWKRAHEELIDVIESFVINKQELSDATIENLVEASERSHKVRLRPTCDSESLLQDLSLRLQRSPHLDYKQKTEYVTKLERLIESIRQSEEFGFMSFADDPAHKNIEGLEEAVPEQRKPRARDLTDSANTTRDAKKWRNRKEAAFSNVIIPIIAGLATFLSLMTLARIDSFQALLTRVIEKLNGSPIFYVLPAAVGAMLLFQAWLTARRIRHRKHQEAKEMDAVI